MVAPSSPCLHLGAVGWDHDAWEGPFYPDDLPREWRLEYYANEFPAVMLPARQLSAVRRDMAEQWLEDLPERFRFHLHLSARQPLGKSVWSLIHMLRPRVAGVLLDVGCCTTQVRLVRERLPDAILAWSQVPESGDSPSTSIVEPCWRPDSGDRATAALGVVPPARRPMRQLRALLESFVRACGAHRDATLFFDGEDPDVDELRNASTIAGLLGVL